VRVCAKTICTRRTFAERLGEQMKASARRTKRCQTQLQTIGLMLGGNAGARLAKLLGMAVSSDTLLRLIRALEVPQRAVPEVLGIDDFGATRSCMCSCKTSERRILPGILLPVPCQAE
jgi:hypothetical protein